MAGEGTAADFRGLSRTAPAAARDKDQERVDRAEILTYRGLLYEIDNSPENALSCYREVARVFPGRTQLKERITGLEKNGRSPTPPEDLAKILLFRSRHVCAGEEDHK